MSPKFSPKPVMAQSKLGNFKRASCRAKIFYIAIKGSKARFKRRASLSAGLF